MPCRGTPAAGRFIPSHCNAGRTPAVAGRGQSDHPGRAKGPPDHLGRRGRGLLRRADGGSAGDPDVAANVLVTVTSHPSEVEHMSTRTWRGLRAPFGIVVFLLVFVAGSIAASAQTPFVPYYNKNRIKYDHFKWHTYTTDH